MKKQVLFLALAATLAAAPAYAIKINDSAFVANGGDLSNVEATAPNVFEALRNASLAEQFQVVGRLGNCTATLLGVESGYAWLLTSATCVPNTQIAQSLPNTVRFTNDNGVVLAVGGQGATSFVHPNRFAAPSGVGISGTDIAMVRLKLGGATDHDVPVSMPTIYDGTAETTQVVSYVSYGTASITGASNQILASVGDRRAWGESIVDGSSQNGHALFSNYQAGSATRWAGLGPTDKGGSWWQQRNGQWQIVATNHGGTSLQSTGTRVSKYATWINDLFPGARLAGESHAPLVDAPEVTNTRQFMSDAFNNKTAFVKAAGQPGVDAPETLNSGSTAEGFTWMSAPVINAETGVASNVVLRAHRASDCGDAFPINIVRNCTNAKLAVVYDASMNTHLRDGLWHGRVVVEALEAPASSPTSKGTIELDIAVTGSSPKNTFEYESKNLAATTSSVYFTIPTQAAASGPTSGLRNISTTAPSLITVNARNAITQQSVQLKLRAQRERGTCGAMSMNNAMPCGADHASVLKIWFDPIDNPGLAAGTRYSGKFNVQARSWGNSTVNQTFPVNVNVNLLP